MAEVNSVRKAFAILDLLSDGEKRSLSEIARELSLPKSTAFGLLETLTAERVLERDPHSGLFSLGIRLIELGYCTQIGHDLVRIAAPFLRGLNQRFDETVHLVLLDRDEVLYIDCIESQRRLRTYSVIGVRAPLHCTSVGKAILAFLPESEIQRIITHKGLPSFTPHTLTTEERILQEIATIRERGYAIDDREHEDHLRCVGAPIFNAEGNVFASISISGPAERNTLERIESMTPALLAATAEISRRLGYRDRQLSRANG
ncbi:MAG TPA: IclR family transcriptional regulator [Spirochaetia bacterium]|jgi:DNA-binding IclR family transcriptional regulator|nr:IclR family transcriptional regulator [Spirochaetia bacterium]